VVVSTCHENTFLDTKIAIWEYTDCAAYSTYVQKGAQDDTGSENCSVGLGNPNYSSIADACGLTIGQTYLVQVCSYSDFSTPGAFDITVEPTVCEIGIKEATIQSSLKIYPNPSNGNEVTIEFNATANKGTASIEIVDITGKAVKTYNYKNVAAGNFKQQLDVTNLSNGLYFVNIISDGKIASNKLQIIK
jgi:hypothetical protein